MHAAWNSLSDCPVNTSTLNQHWHFRKNWILKLLREEPIFLYLKRQIFSTYRGSYFLGVAIVRVSLNDRAQIFVKKATVYENDMTQFVFIFSTRIKCEEWKECDMKKYFLFCVTFVTIQVKINYLEEWSSKYFCWQLISTLLSLMINKSMINNFNNVTIIFIVNFEHISHLFPVFLLLTSSK